MPDYNPRASRAQGQLIIADEKTAVRHLVTSTVLPAEMHGFHPDPVLPGQTFHFFPHVLHTQYASECDCFPFVQNPQIRPGGPVRRNPQQPLPAE
jgi:hypothetical protein